MAEHIIAVFDSEIERRGGGTKPYKCWYPGIGYPAVCRRESRGR